MLLTVPVLYYKPIQELPLKINRGTKKEDGREERDDRFRGGGGRGRARDLGVQKHFHSRLKALFCFPESH